MIWKTHVTLFLESTVVFSSLPKICVMVMVHRTICIKAKFSSALYHMYVEKIPQDKNCRDISRGWTHAWLETLNKEKVCGFDSM